MPKSEPLSLHQNSCSGDSTCCVVLCFRVLFLTNKIKQVIGCGKKQASDADPFQLVRRDQDQLIRATRSDSQHETAEKANKMEFLYVSFCLDALARKRHCKVITALVIIYFYHLVDQVFCMCFYLFLI